MNLYDSFKKQSSYFVGFFFSQQETPSPALSFSILRCSSSYSLDIDSHGEPFDILMTCLNALAGHARPTV